MPITRSGIDNKGNTNFIANNICDMINSNASDIGINNSITSTNSIGRSNILINCGEEIIDLGIENKINVLDGKDFNNYWWSP